MKIFFKDCHPPIIDYLSQSRRVHYKRVALYLEPYHPQMECDSVHRLTERKLKNREIHLPRHYAKLQGMQSTSKTLGDKASVEYTSVKLGCGGILKSKLGNIASPSSMDGFYPHNITCTWLIIAPPKHIIQLSWLAFHLELSYDCVYDSIEIYDNSTHLGEGEMLGRYCGSKMPPVLFSTSNIMSVKFISDTTLNTDGFLATYLMMHDSSTCGGNFFTSSGAIKSPGYPNPYPNNIDCSWTINTKPGQQILLSVEDFEVESYPDCKYDYLEIRNGGTSASPLIGVYCGKDIPKEIPSHINQVYLHFKSDLSRDGRGFSITWSSTATGCGGTLTSPSGSIISPHYPEPYNRYAECNWRILVNAGSVIQSVFSDIDLERSSQCLADYVELFDGGTRQSLGRFCSADDIKPITTTKNEMLVLFRSDIAFQGRGFSLRYHTVCNIKLTGFGGVIESPNFPTGVPRDMDCTWEIVVPQGNKINITFSHFDVTSATTPSYSEDNSTCPLSYVEISYVESEEDESSPFVSYGKYCGTNPGHLTISSNDAKVHFVSRGEYGTGDQLRLEWALFGCGGHLRGNSGSITSPNYPDIYPKNTKCEWLIEVAYGYSIEIEFQELEVETEPSCIYDHVKIYNGMDNTYTLLTTVCHQRKSTIVSSTGNFMFIEFQSDYSLSGRGFKANYSAIPTTCGGKFVATEGVITSPNYPQNYNKNETCEWMIDVDESHSVELVFEDVDLLLSNNCTFNYVKVFDGPSAAYPVLATVCGQTTPNKTFRSTYNNMFVEFVSHELVTTKGFRAKYRKACGSRITTQSSGMIRVGKDEFTRSECLWVITSSEPTQHVSLSITHLESNSYCDGGDYYEYKDYSIYDGDSDQAPLIKSYCGPKIPPTITSNGNSLTIKLSDNVEFVATYSVFDSHCGGTFTALEGYFSTPGYPKVYPTDIQCEWIFPSAPGNTLSINFIDFDLSESENCNRDFLEVRSKNASGKLLGVFCGKNKPDNLTHQDSLWVYFRSSRPLEGETVTNKGFYAQYGLSYQNELTGEKGEIYSVLYPKMFKVNGEFSWRITVKERKKILLTFKEFELDSTDESFCYRSKINVYDGYDIESKDLGEFCGTTIPKPLKSSSNVMFISAYVLSQFGIKFVLEWQEIDDYRNILQKKSCGSTDIISLNSTVSNYTLTSPGYPTGYAHNLECQWIFSTASMNHLAIVFQDVNFGIRVAGFFATTCQYMDLVQLYQKSAFDDDWQKIKTICQTTLEVVHATNLLKVEFVTTRFRNGTGFKALVYAGCGGLLTEPSGYITFDENSTKGIECQWNITVRSTRQIELTFEEINIPESANGMCNNYLMVKNGISQESPFLGNGKYCGSIVPEKLTSTGNNLYVKYKGNRNSKFRLRYQEKVQGCGGDITLTKYDPTDEIQSPNYPNIPTSHTECHWVITAPIDDSVRIDFEDRFDLSIAKSCSVEYVEIRDGGTENSALLGRYCEDPPNSVISTGNMLFVKYFTDTDDPKNGFSAKVSIAACGGTLRGTYGELTYKNRDNQKGGNCTWYLRGPVDHYWEITFTHLNIFSSKPCEKYVAVIEKRAIASNIQEISESYFCGDQLPNNSTSMGKDVIIKFVGNLSDSFSVRYKLNQSPCGGHFKQESGILKSPGYPLMNHVMRDCEWIIEVPKGRRVTLEFLDLDIDYSGHKHGIEVCDGDSYMSSCDSVKSTDRIKESSSNKMTIYYYAILPSTHRGFKAKFSSNFPSICSGGFIGQSGIIQTPTVRNHSYFCTWVYHNEVTLNKTLSLSISAIYDPKAKESNRVCSFGADGIRVTQKSKMSPLLKICYTTPAPLIIRSPFPTLTLEAGIRDSHSMNFTVVYRIHNCGGLVTDQQGEIRTPSYPNAPTDTAECAWLIEVGKGQTINLTVIDLDLSDDCEKTFLSIYNGGSQIKPRISKTCRKLEHPLNVISQSNQLFIEYKFEKGSTGKGVHMKYEASSTGCGGILHDRSRIIQTPNYGSKDYPNNAECLWEFRATTGYHIAFQFQGRFYIEESENCEKDYLEVWDWDEEVWSLQKKLCGRATPHVIKSKSDRLKLIFRSNDRVTAAGFKGRADWECGGNFVASKKPRYIVSPGYPVATEPSQNCVYEVTSPSNIFHIKFLDFDLEPGTGSICEFDNLTIARKHPYYLSEQTYCGSNVPPPITMTGTAIIKLKTDKFVNGKGFKLMYTSEECGGDINNETAIDYTSTIYDNIRINMRLPTVYGCVWKITAPPKQIVALRIVKLQLDSRCISNLQIFNGLNNIQQNKLGKFCGSINSDVTIHSENNTMLVHLLSHPMYRGTVVFKAEVHFSHGPQEGCGGFINLTEAKTITAPHLEKIDCSWIIVAPRDHQIAINVAEVRLPKYCDISNDTCGCASLEIHDGGSPIADMIERICKNVTNERYTTYKNMLFIRLVHYPMTQNAFTITLTPVVPLCGPRELNVTNTIQTLTSPGYPNHGGFKCYYNFYDPNNKISSAIHLHFIEFDLSTEEKSENLQYITQCQGDIIEIIEDQDMGGPGSGLLSPEYVFKGHRKSVSSSYITAWGFLDTKGRHVFCGRDDKPFDYYTSSTRVTLFYDGTKGKDHGRGFKLEYSLAGCNRNYTELQGRVSNGYNNTECLVSITVPENRTISLFFNLLQMKNVNQCSNDALEIRDGSPTGTLLTKVCGYAIPDPVFSHTNKVFIHIYSKTQPHLDRMRYDISYTSTDKGRGCGGTLYGTRGRVYSPMYPHPFRNETTCTWIIRVPVGHRTVLKIMAYDLEGPCDKTYLNIVTHSSTGKATSSTLCPSDDPDVFKSESYITLSYTSSIHNDGKGWELFYQAVPKDVALV
ncbi:unnamed protein product [Acanthoscelides obtectus]|uniref:CUB domain-containing protein n=1 Tax=Acanthoscelides obtectus TaxID=200917 RepID=A0A9P0PKI4_ACAOB|nr:unnamed protein product [Acanthoscelides obtectus]CAK1627741.1 Cubilin [Acanthoscelides obtectus]